MNFEEAKKTINEYRGVLNSLERQMNEYTANLESLNEYKEAISIVQLIVQRTARDTQDKLIFRVSSIVQSALDVVFPGKYEFVMEFKTKRGHTECYLYVKCGTELMNPVEANGGGLLDVMALALRIAALSMSTHDRVLLLDEPLKFLSSDLKAVASEMFKSISKDLGIQLIMVSHDKEFIAAADRQFNVKMVDGKSIVTQYDTIVQ